MNDDEIVRLAALGNALRPDWPFNSLHTFVSRHLTHRGYGDTAVALAWIAAKTQTQTPRLLLEAGVWWQAALIDSPNTAPRFERYDPAICCDVCSKPEHRHGPHEDHPFESANAATSRRNRENAKQPIRELITITQEEA
jgi:hypothetical protein